MEETHHCATHWGHWGKTSPCPGEASSLVSRCIEFISKMPGQAWSTGLFMFRDWYPRVSAGREEAPCWDENVDSVL